MTLFEGYSGDIGQTQLVPLGSTLHAPDHYDEKVYVDGSGDGHICIIFEGSEPIIEQHSKKTNNESEWQALYNALTYIDSYDWYLVYSDSRLIVRQYKGEYKTTNPRMRRWKQKCRKCVNARGLNANIEWISRPENLAGQHLEQYLLINRVNNGKYLHW